MCSVPGLVAGTSERLMKESWQYFMAASSFDTEFWRVEDHIQLELQVH